MSAEPPASPDIDALVAELNRRVGLETAPTTTEIDKSLIRKFAIAIGDPNPLYCDEAHARTTRFGGIVAPPTFVSALMTGHWPEIVMRGLPFEKELHLEDKVTLDRDIRPGDVLTRFARFTGAYARETPRGVRLYQTNDFLVHDATGKRVAHVEITSVAF